MPEIRLVAEIAEGMGALVVLVLLFRRICFAIVRARAKRAASRQGHSR